MDTKLKVLDLFSGIGGFSLGLERAGFETIAFCEIEPFCQSVLRKHWQNVPIAGNIKDLRYEKGILYDKDTPIYQGHIDLICGGFPCQPFSIAKNRTRRKKGTADDFMFFGVTSGQKCSELLPKSNLLGLCAKMLLTSCVWHSSVRRLTWKAKVTSCNHLLYQLAVSARPIDEIECGLLPTPKASDVMGGLALNTTHYQNGKFVRISKTTGQKFGANLPNVMNKIALLPTPTASDASQGAVIGKNDQFYMTKTGMPRKVNASGIDGSVGLARLVRLLPTLTASEYIPTAKNRYVGSQHFRGSKTSEGLRTTSSDPIYLNPSFAEAMMGFPLGWTDLKP